MLDIQSYIGFFRILLVAIVRENIWKKNIFPSQWKVGEFCGWPGKFRKDLGSQGKVREFENSYGRQSSENLFILFKRKKMYFLMR